MEGYLFLLAWLVLASSLVYFGSKLGNEPMLCAGAVMLLLMAGMEAVG